eukprot:m.44554 g.44554  ORF g.44554 m.44554 type:complete len:907 (+) comp10839_c0_seq2:134-2854(+)
MDGTVSLEEFALIQQALMQLKEEKYQVDDVLKRATRELDETKSSLATTQKDLAKATKTIQRSKKAKEVQAMMEQHEQEIAERDTRQEGLMQNLTELSMENEELQKKVLALQKSSSTTASRNSLNQQGVDTAKAERAALQQQFEIERTALTAANAKLSAAFEELQTKYRALVLKREGNVTSEHGQSTSHTLPQARLESGSDELAQFNAHADRVDAPGEADASDARARQAVVPDVEAVQDGIAGAKGQEDEEDASLEGNGGDDTQSTAVEGETEEGELLECESERADVGNGNLVEDKDKQLSVLESPEYKELLAANMELTDLLATTERSYNAQTESLQARLDALMATHETVKQELTTAREQLETFQESQLEAQQDTAAASEWEEKFKRKQAALVNLQEEKEALYTKHAAALESMKAAHGAEMESLVSKHKAEVEALQVQLSDALSESQNATSALEKLRTDSSRAASKATDSLARVTSEKNLMEVEFKKEIESLTEQTEQLQSDLTDANSHIVDLKQRLESEQTARDQDTTKQELEEATQQLEKWKLVVNDKSAELHSLADKHQKDLTDLTTKHYDEISEIEASHSEQVKSLSTELHSKTSDLEAARQDIESSRKLCEALQEQVEKAKSEISALQEKVEGLTKEASSLRDSLVDTRSASKSLILGLFARFRQVAQAMKAENDQLNQQIIDLQQTVDQLETEKKERDSTKSKDAALLKELRKQLSREQRRVDKMERELTSTAPSTQSSRTGSPRLRRAGHRRSDSSSSFASARTAASADTSLIMESASSHTTHSQEPIITQSEHERLLHAMTTLQTEREELKHKATYLERKLDDLTTELQAKSLVLDKMAQGQHASARGSPVKSLGSKQSTASLIEANRSMQTVLEETLLKNIQLEKCLETLTQQPAASP